MIKAVIEFHESAGRKPKFKIVREDNGKLLSYASTIDQCNAIAECEGWELEAGYCKIISKKGVRRGKTNA